MEVNEPQTDRAGSPGEAGGVAGGAEATSAGEASGGELGAGRVPPGAESTPLGDGMVAEEERPNRSGSQGAEVPRCRFCDPAQKLSRKQAARKLRTFLLKSEGICFQNPKKLPAFPPLNLPGSDRVCDPHYFQQFNAKKLHLRAEDEGGTSLEGQDPGPAAGSGSTVSPQDLFPSQHHDVSAAPALLPAS